MRKIILSFIHSLKVNSKSDISFAIRKTTRGSEVQHTPVAKVKGLFADWTPIIKIYPNEYMLLPYEVNGLTVEECQQHIDGYKQQLAKEGAEKQFSVEYTEIL